MSYQSGGIPSFNTSQAGGLGALEDAEAESPANLWETRYGLRVDVLAAWAYLVGPISGTFFSSAVAISTHCLPLSVGSAHN